MKTFGTYIREVREQKGKDFSLRKVSERLSISASLLSKIERDLESPSENIICALAKEYELNEHVLLAMNGKISSKLKTIIIERPEFFAQAITFLEEVPETAFLKIIREVKDGEW